MAIMVKTGVTKIKTMRLDQAVIKKLEDMAERENRNFNNMVETILIKALA